MILLPTLNRPDQLRQFLDSAIKAKTASPGMVIVDNEDNVKNGEAYEELLIKVEQLGWNYAFTDAVSMGDKIREVWPKVTENPDRYWVCVLNDDHRIVTEYWDKKLITHLDGANFVSCNDRWAAPMKAAGATIWSIDLLKHLDWPIYPPKLQHLFIDDLWEKVGRSSGCWKVLMNVVVEHHHAMKGESPQDETYRKVYAKTAWDADQAIFNAFMQNDFQKTVEKIIEFRRERAISVSNRRLAAP